MPKKWKAWLKAAKAKGSALLNQPKSKKSGSAIRDKLSKKLQSLDFDPKKIDFKNLSQYSGWFRWGLLVLAMFLLAEVGSRVLGTFIRPTYTPLPKSSARAARPSTPVEDYDAILHRNIFNVEGKIPDPFDQGLLDCMSQAKPTNEKIQLLGTIVMNDERLSVALIQDDSGKERIGVRKDDNFFDNKYLAMKVERKKLCFQVKSSQELEFVEIPDDSAGLGVSAAIAPTSGGGIVPKSETEYVVKKGFLDEKINDLTNILQSARAVPYIEPGTGKFKGFLVQSMDQNSLFSQLGVHQGDVITGVNNIPMDNPGRGLEAFQALRNTPKITVNVMRGGSPTTLSFDVN